MTDPPPRRRARLIVTGSRAHTKKGPGWTDPIPIIGDLNWAWHRIVRVGGGTLHVMHGDASSGVDWYVRCWCELGLPHVVHEPRPVKEWTHHPTCGTDTPPNDRYRCPGTSTTCSRAGLHRNDAMIAEAVADAVEHPDFGALTEARAFWDGKSSGTGHCIGAAKRAGLPVPVILWPDRYDLTVAPPPFAHRRPPLPTVEALADLTRERTPAWPST
jgi:hypothetical protein